MTSSGIAGLPPIPEEWMALDGDASEWPEGFGDERRRGRAVAVQVLYEVDLTKRDPSTVVDRRIADDRTPPASASAVRALVGGVVARLAEIDRTLADGAPQWPVQRIDPVERSILRVATFELLHARGEGDRSSERVPVRVAINEAVELARLFGTEASKQRYLPEVCSGKRIAAFALSEPEGGSDVSALRTTAQADGDHYVIKDRKSTRLNSSHT